MQWIKPGTNIDFMGKARLAYLASGILVGLSLIGILVWPTPRYGVDFAGGASLQIKVRSDITAPQLAEALTAQGYDSPEVVTAEDGSFLIRVRVEAPSDGSRDELATAIRDAVSAAPPPAAAPPAPPVPAAAPATDPAAATPPALYRTPLNALVAALAARQVPPPEPGTTGAEPPPEAPVAAAPPADPDAGAGDVAAAPVGDAGPADLSEATAVDAAPALPDVPLLEPADATAPEVVALVEPPVEPPPPPPPPPVEPVEFRVYEVLVDQSGAKVDIQMSQPITPERLRDTLAPIVFQGRPMGDMIGLLKSSEDSIVETQNPDGTYHYDVSLAPTVNLNEQDVTPVQGVVRGAVEAAGLVPVGSIKAVTVVLAPVAVGIDSTTPIDRAGLARTMSRTRYRDVNLLPRCHSSICPTLIDEREQVYGYEVLLRGFGPDVVESLQEKLGADAVTEVLSMEWVGPKVGEKLRNDGIMSVLIALGLILVYVALRFDLRFAPGAVLCLFHDATITLGFFCFTGMEVNLTTVAAILTIVGYSINDTIVVYDRIRENLQKTQERELSKVINSAINETLSRTVLTSFTTVLAIITVVVLGTGSIQDFAIAMTLGVVVGTYSSIYVAAPLSIYLDKVFFRRRA